VRVDNNSAFGTNFNRIAYPKFSVSYVASEEPVLRDRLAAVEINSLKLRGAWGKAGRSPNPYSATQTYSVSTATLGTTSVSALRTSSYGNPNLKPETGTEYEVGFDLGALRDRIGMEFTYYNKQTDDLLVAVPVAPSNGFNSSPQTNFGSIRNRGVEMSLTASPVMQPNFSWDARITYAANRNTLLSVPDTNTARAISGQAYTPGAQENHLGYPLGGYWIQLPLRDANGAYVLTASRAIALAPQKSYIGSPVPLHEIGFSNTLTFFKNFSLYGLLDYKGGHYLFNGRERQRCLNGNNCEFVNTPGRDSIDIKAWRQSTNYEPYVEKADFVKLRDLSLTYQVPQRLLSFTGSQSASLVLAGHDHHYERFAPQRPDGTSDPEHGIRQFVVGTGGQFLRPFEVIRANSEVRDAKTFGVIRLKLRADGYDWEFLPASGNTFRDAGSSGCHNAPDTTTVYLGKGRFKAEVTWKDFDGNTGPGRAAAPAADSSGLFHFFGPDNWELLVKVLDGCGRNGHFWVFVGPATNLQYLLTVTDTRTGQVRVYFNPQGVTPQAVTDTYAFEGCP